MDNLSAYDKYNNEICNWGLKKLSLALDIDRFSL